MEEYTLREHALRFKALMMSELDLRFEKYINDYTRAKEEERDDWRYELESVYDYFNKLRYLATGAADDVKDVLYVIYEKD